MKIKANNLGFTESQGIGSSQSAKPSAYIQSINYLSLREHSTKELSFKLIKKGYSEKEVQQTIVRLKEQDYLSDIRFTEVYARSKVAKRYGPTKISHELSLHDISSFHIKQVLKQHRNDFLDNVIYLIEKRLSNQSMLYPLKNTKEKNKIIHSLKLKGYDYDLINQGFSYIDNE